MSIFAIRFCRSLFVLHNSRRIFISGRQPYGLPFNAIACHSLPLLYHRTKILSRPFFKFQGKKFFEVKKARIFVIRDLVSDGSSCNTKEKFANSCPNDAISFSWASIGKQKKRPHRSAISLKRTNYSLMVVTTPEPTVLPPSRIAKRRPLSIAIGVISSTPISMLSPGLHI